MMRYLYQSFWYEEIVLYTVLYLYQSFCGRSFHCFFFLRQNRGPSIVMDSI
jgi:hypothetical protein